MSKNLSNSLNRPLTRESFKHHAGNMNVPFDASWNGTILSLLSEYSLTPLGRLDLTLRTPHLIPEPIAAKLCLFLFEKIRTYSGVSGVHSDLLYFELRRLTKTVVPHSPRLAELHAWLSGHVQWQYFENFSQNKDSPTLAILACCSWWNYPIGAYASLSVLKAGLPQETWSCWVNDCLNKLIELVREELFRNEGV